MAGERNGNGGGERGREGERKNMSTNQRYKAVARKRYRIKNIFFLCGGKKTQYVMGLGI